MIKHNIEETRLKEILKAALIETLEEPTDLLRDAVEEALEDIAMVRAIEEGETSGLVSRDEVMKILESEK